MNLIPGLILEFCFNAYSLYRTTKGTLTNIIVVASIAVVEPVVNNEFFHAELLFCPVVSLIDSILPEKDGQAVNFGLRAVTKPAKTK